MSRKSTLLYYLFIGIKVIISLLWLIPSILLAIIAAVISGIGEFWADYFVDIICYPFDKINEFFYRIDDD